MPACLHRSSGRSMLPSQMSPGCHSGYYRRFQSVMSPAPFDLSWLLEILRFFCGYQINNSLAQRHSKTGMKTYMGIVLPSFKWMPCRSESWLKVVSQTLIWIDLVKNGVDDWYFRLMPHWSSMRLEWKAYHHGRHWLSAAITHLLTLRGNSLSPTDETMSLLKSGAKRKMIMEFERNLSCPAQAYPTHRPFIGQKNVRWQSYSFISWTNIRFQTNSRPLTLPIPATLTIPSALATGYEKLSIRIDEELSLEWGALSFYRKLW